MSDDMTWSDHFGSINSKASKNSKYDYILQILVGLHDIWLKVDFYNFWAVCRDKVTNLLKINLV